MPQRAGAITAPLLVVHGEQDKLIPVEGSRTTGRVRRLAPTCTSRCTPSCTTRCSTSPSSAGARRRHLVDRGEAVKRRCCSAAFVGAADRGLFVGPAAGRRAARVGRRGGHVRRRRADAARHLPPSRGGRAGPAALLISESGNTDRNGDNEVAGPIGNMRQLAELLSDRGRRQPALRQGRHRAGPGSARTQQKPQDVGSAVYTAGAKAAVALPRRASRHRQGASSVYALGEGTVHAMALAGDDAAGRTEDPLAGPVSTASGPLPRHHHQPGDGRRVTRDGGGVAGRRRADPHQGHGARDAARRPGVDRQPRQRQGRRRSRQDRPAGAGRRGTRGHARCC